MALLAAYKAAHGDCNVTQGWSEDPRLGRWVTTQRKLKRKLDRREPSDGMTAARAPGSKTNGARLCMGGLKGQCS
jgi:hypothetical protein